MNKTLENIQSSFSILKIRISTYRHQSCKEHQGRDRLRKKGVKGAAYRLRNVPVRNLLGGLGLQHLCYVDLTLVKI